MAENETQGSLEGRKEAKKAEREEKRRKIEEVATQPTGRKMRVRGRTSIKLN